MSRPGDLPDAGLIDTAEGPTFVRVMGTGPPVFVIHGGPAWDHSYLLDDLAFLAERRTLIFYDQPGCGRTPAPAEPSPRQTFRHFRCLCGQVAGSETAGVLAHSWGALVFVAALSQPPSDSESLPDFTEGALVNPAPMTSADIDRARRLLIKGVPKGLLLKLSAMYALNFDPERIVDQLKPYYGRRQHENRDLKTPITMKTYKSLISQLGDIDYSDPSEQVQRLFLLIGESDYAGTRFIAALAARAQKTLMIPSAGHFPFHEAPEAFRAALAEVFP